MGLNCSSSHCFHSVHRLGSVGSLSSQIRAYLVRCESTGVHVHSSNVSMHVQLGPFPCSS